MGGEWLTGWLGGWVDGCDSDCCLCGIVFDMELMIVGNSHFKYGSGAFIYYPCMLLCVLFDIHFPVVVLSGSFTRWLGSPIYLMSHSSIIPTSLACGVVSSVFANIRPRFFADTSKPSDTRNFCNDDATMRNLGKYLQMRTECCVVEFKLVIRQMSGR